MKRDAIARLTVLFHHRWAVPVLAELHRCSGAKFVTLAKRLGSSRDSLRQTLDALIRQGWVMRNPGHGHPMRPEYILTPAGTTLGPWCQRLMGLLSSLGKEDVGLKKWSMPVAVALRAGKARFSEIQALLPGSTARALALTLKSLQNAELVERFVSEDYPPATFYHLTREGRRLASVAGNLS